MQNTYWIEVKRVNPNRENQNNIRRAWLHSYVKEVEIISGGVEVFIIKSTDLVWRIYKYFMGTQPIHFGSTAV